MYGEVIQEEALKDHTLTYLSAHYCASSRFMFFLFILILSLSLLPIITPTGWSLLAESAHRLV